MIFVKRILTAVLVLFAGGCLCLSSAFAYGGGLQEDKYPQILVKENFTSLAEEKILEELDKLGEKRRHTLALTRSPRTMRCPAGKLNVSAHIPRDIRYGGITPVYVSVYVDGELFRRVICYYRINVYGNVVVAKHDLALEKELTAEDLRIAEKEIADRADEYLTDVADALGKVPSRVIHEGTPITKNMLQNPLVVEVGAPITILSDRGGIRVQVEGFALMRGRIGSIIRVRNAKSRKVMRGRVIDASTVEIL